MEKRFLEAAEKYIEENIGHNFSLSPDSIIDLNDIFCFYHQSKKYFETGDHQYISLGVGPHLLIKSDERIISLPPSYTYDAAIREVRKKIEIEKFIKTQCPNYNYWHDNYILIIRKVYNEEKLISVLRDYHVSYIIPEIKENCIRRVGKPYHTDELTERFKNLPAEFNTLYGLFSQLLTELIQSSCCEFSIIPKTIRTNDSCAKNAIEQNHEILW